jgi:hypothetical protein
MGYNVDNTKENTKTVTDASKQVSLKVKAEETKNMLLSRHQNASPNHVIRIGNRSFENVAELKIFGNDNNT